MRVRITEISIYDPLHQFRSDVIGQTGTIPDTGHPELHGWVSIILSLDEPIFLLSIGKYVDELSFFRCRYDEIL